MRLGGGINCVWLLGVLTTGWLRGACRACVGRCMHWLQSEAHERGLPPQGIAGSKPTARRRRRQRGTSVNAAGYVPSRHAAPPPYVQQPVQSPPTAIATTESKSRNARPPGPNIYTLTRARQLERRRAVVDAGGQARRFAGRRVAGALEVHVGPQRERPPRRDPDGADHVVEGPLPQRRVGGVGPEARARKAAAGAGGGGGGTRRARGLGAKHEACLV